MLSTNNIPLTTGISQKFSPKYIGPFTITQKLASGLSYRLDLPVEYKIHPVFHYPFWSPTKRIYWIEPRQEKLDSTYQKHKDALTELWQAEQRKDWYYSWFITRTLIHQKTNASPSKNWKLWRTRAICTKHTKTSNSQEHSRTNERSKREEL